MGTLLIPSAALAGLAGVDLAVASSDGCASVLSSSRLVRGWLDAVEAQATARLTELHAAGHSPPAADTHTKCGGVSAAEARRKERRSKTINDAPGFGDALAGGDIGAEHVDALSAATARLDDTVKAALLDDQDDLLEAARSQTPEKFGQTVRDRARVLEADHGIERNKQQRKQTFISHRVNHETGMHEGRFAFHPELGARIFSAIDRQVLRNIKAGTRRGEREFVDRTFDYSQQAAEALGTIVSTANSNTETMSATSPGSSSSPRTGTGSGTDPSSHGDGTDHTGTRGAPAPLDTDHPGEYNRPVAPSGRGGNAGIVGDWDRDHPGEYNRPVEPSGRGGNAGIVGDCDRDHLGESNQSTRPAARDHNASTVGDFRTGDASELGDPAGVGVNAGMVDDQGGSRAIEADITVIIDYATLTTGEFHDHSVCETSYGTVLPPASVQRLLCNGRVTPVIVDSNGNPFNLGRTVRHANRKQRRALRAIYRSCGFPGCDVGFWRCEIHHIHPWELGGLTDLANLLPICSRHHHVIHEGGWQLHLAPDRTLTITQPNSQTYGTAQPDIRSGSPPGRTSRKSPGPPTDGETTAPTGHLREQPAQTGQTGQVPPVPATDGAATRPAEHPTEQPAQTGQSSTRSAEWLGHDCEQMNLLAG